MSAGWGLLAVGADIVQETGDSVTAAMSQDAVTKELSKLADEEDITRNADGKLQFKERAYGDGMGYVILRKDKTFAEQVTKENTIYEIRYAFDLNGQTCSIPSGCILRFVGGILSNGVLVHNNCSIESDGVCFDNVTFSSSYNRQVRAEWWGVLPTCSSNSQKLNAIFQFCTDVFVGNGKYNMEAPIIISGAVRNFTSNYDGSKRLTLFNFHDSDGFVVKTRCVVQNFNLTGDSGCKGRFDSAQNKYVDGHMGIDVQTGCDIKNINITNFQNGLNLNKYTIVAASFENITVSYSGNYGIYLVHSDSAQKNNISFCHIYVVNTGYRAEELSVDSTLTDCGIGMYVRGGYCNSFSDCVSEYNTGVGLLVDGTSASIMQGNMFSTMYFERNKYANVIIHVYQSNERVKNNVFKSFFISDAGNSPVANANANREIIIMSNFLQFGNDPKNGAYGFEINQVNNDIISRSVNESGVDINTLYKMGISEDESLVLKKDSVGGYIELAEGHSGINTIGPMKLIKKPQGIYRFKISAQSYNTSSLPSLYCGLTINGTLKGLSRNIQETDNYMLDLGIYYLPNKENTVQLEGSYISNRTSLSEGWEARLRGFYMEEVSTVTTAERTALALDSSMAGTILFDKTLGKSIVWSGSSWVNLDGTAI